jgi:hypothetical protein
MLRGLQAIAIYAAVFSAVHAVAASVPLRSDGLAAGFDQIHPCDSDDLTVAYNVVRDTGPDNRWEVAGLTVGGLAGACIGGDLWLVVVESSGVAIGAAGPVAVTSGSISVDLVPDLPATPVAGVRLAIVGP